MQSAVRPSSVARLATDEDRALRVSRFAQFLRITTPVTLAFAALYLGVGIVLSRYEFVLAGLTVVGFVVVLFVARARLRAQRLESAAELVAMGLCVMCVVGAPLLPWLRTPLLLMPVAGVALVLPDVPPARLRRLLWFAFASEVLIVTVATIAPVRTVPPEWVRVPGVISASVISIGVTFGLLWHDSNRLRRSLATADFHALRLRAVVERAPIVVFAIDGEARFTISEGYGLATMGLRPGEVVGRSVSDLLAAYGGVEWFRSAVARVLAGETVFASGGFGGRHFEVYLRPLGDGAIGVSTDVTRREEATRRLRLLSDASRVLAEPVKSEAEALDRVARLAVREFATECRIELVENGGQLRRAAAARREMATGEPLATISAPLMSGDGRPLGVLMLSSAERVFTEDDTVLVEDLAARAATALESKRLYDDAQRAVRVRDEFLSIASHELKTPLTPLRLQATAIERALDRGDLSRLREKASGMHRQVDRINMLVEELLDVGRIRSGRLLLDRSSTDLASVVRAVLERMHGELEGAGCVASLSVVGDPHGEWDASRIDQIVTNLLSNAVKYGPNAPISIEVRGGRDDVWLTVTDRGIGISAEDQTRIFQRFERAVSDRNYGGLGLGLFIVHEFVTAHGGDVSVRSAPGEGAAFVVRLPRAPAQRLSAS